MFTWQNLVVLLVVVVLVFGTKKLRTLGSDLGTAVKGFKKAMEDEEPKNADVKNLEKAAPSAETAEKAKEKEQA